MIKTKIKVFNCFSIASCCWGELVKKVQICDLWVSKDYQSQDIWEQWTSSRAGAKSKYPQFVCFFCAWEEEKKLRTSIWRNSDESLMSARNSPWVRLWITFPNKSEVLKYVSARVTQPWQVADRLSLPALKLSIFFLHRLHLRADKSLCSAASLNGNLKCFGTKESHREFTFGTGGPFLLRKEINYHLLWTRTLRSSSITIAARGVVVSFWWWKVISNFVGLKWLFGHSEEFWDKNLKKIAEYKKEFLFRLNPETNFCKTRTHENPKPSPLTANHS